MQLPSRLRTSLYTVAHVPPIRRVAERLPFARRLYGGRRHPFDAANGTDTSGFIPADDLAPDAVTAARMNPYVGSQPSIVRASLALLPDHRDYAFVDLGCGKGRPLAVASEFAFRRLIGVEIAPRLAAVARANAAVIASRHPDRTPIEIEVGDATAVEPPAEQVVYFLYHAFPRPVAAALVATLERQIAAGCLRHLFLVSYNPVWGDIMDAWPFLARWAAETFPYAPEEIGYGPDLKDTVVIWQSVPNRYPARPGAERSIVVTKPLWYAELQE